MITFLMNLYFLLVQYLGLLILTLLTAHLDTQNKRKFFSDVQNFYWDDPYLFKYCPNQIYQRCILDNEVSSVMKFYHSEACGVISHQERQLQKSYKVDFIGPPCSRTHIHSTKPVKIVQGGIYFKT